MKLSLVLILGLCGCGRDVLVMDTSGMYTNVEMDKVVTPKDDACGVGFNAGVINAWMVLNSGVTVTNFNDLIIRCRSQQSNALAVYRKTNP